MTQEAEVSTAEETQNQSAEQTQETPEVVTPENVEATEQEQAPQKSEETDVERERKRFQRRMDRRTAELYRERAEREALAARLAQYEQQQPSEQQQTQPKSDPVALAREIAAVERFTERCNAVAAEGAKTFTDFNEALASFAAEVGPIADKSGRPTVIGQVLLEAEAPAALLHYLGKNPDVAAELADLTPTQLARRMDRIERDMKEAAKPKVSNAPKPLKPVTGGGGTAVKDPSQMTDAEWRASRLATK